MHLNVPLKQFRLEDRITVEDESDEKFKRSIGWVLGLPTLHLRRGIQYSKTEPLVVIKNFNVSQISYIKTVQLTNFTLESVYRSVRYGKKLSQEQ